jgi:hypothetical protein
MCKYTCSGRLTGSLHFVTNRLYFISFVIDIISMLLVGWLNLATDADVTVFQFCNTVRCSLDCILQPTAPTTDVTSDLLSSPPSFVSLNQHSRIQNVLNFSRFMERAVLAETVLFPFSVTV